MRSSPALDGGVDEPLAVGVHRHVARHRHQPIAELGGQRLEPIDPSGAHDDGRAGAVEHPGEAVAQPRRGAGDDGDLAIEGEEVERERANNVVHGRRFW